MSQVLVAVVAEGRVLGALAGAERHRARARRLPFERLEAVALVRAIAERLALGTPAAAPPVALARDHIDRDRLASADFGGLARAIAHDAPPASVASHASPQAFASPRT